MTLQRLLADYRKTARRLRRRSLLASQRQIQAWKRRLAYLAERIRMAGGRNLRRVAMATTVAALTLPSLQGAASPGTPTHDQSAGNGNFTMRVNHKSNLPTYYDQGATFGYPYWNETNNQSAAFGDLDGDGDLDAVVAGYYRDYLRIAYFKNTGNSKEPNFVEVPSAESPIPTINNNGYIYAYDGDSDYFKVSLVDLDHDGDLDLIVSSFHHIFYYKNTGTSTSPKFELQSGATDPFDFINSNSPVTQPGSGDIWMYYMSASFVDIDGDGDLDMFVAADHYDYFRPAGYGQQDPKTFFFKNTGGAGAPKFELQSTANNPLEALVDPFNQQFNFVFVDANGDGTQDVIVEENYDDVEQLRYFENTGSPTKPVFADRGYIPGLYAYGGTLAAVDIDGDGDMDLYTGIEWTAGEYLIENKGTSKTMKLSQPLEYDHDMSRGDIFGDVDGDGDLDVIRMNGGSLRNDGGQLYNLEYSHPYDQNEDVYSYDLSRAFIDLDGDGDLDLISLGYSGYVQVAFNDGHGGFHQTVYGSNPVSPFYNVGSINHRYYYEYATVGDLDGDGDLDILLTGSYGDRRVLINQGTNAAPNFVDQSYNVGYDPFFTNSIYLYYESRAFLVDLDHDGDADLVSFYNYDETGSTTPHYYRNDSTPGNPVFTELTGAANPFNGVKVPYTDGYVYAEDIDGDGDIDFLMWDYYAGTWATLVNNMPRFTKVDSVAADKGKIIAGPVPQKQGDDICLFVDQPTGSLDFQLFNVAGERVISGLSSSVPGATPCFKADIAPGLYWAHIKSGDRTFTQKIVITAK